MIQEETKECLAVDLGGCPDSLIDHIKEKGYLPKAILLTHGHFDHIMGVENSEMHLEEVNFRFMLMKKKRRC